MTPPTSLDARSESVVGAEFELVARTLPPKISAPSSGLPLKYVLLTPGTPAADAVLSVAALVPGVIAETLAEPLPLVL